MGSSMKLQLNLIPFIWSMLPKVETNLITFVGYACHAAASSIVQQLFTTVTFKGTLDSAASCLTFWLKFIKCHETLP